MGLPLGLTWSFGAVELEASLSASLIESSCSQRRWYWPGGGGGGGGGPSRSGRLAEGGKRMRVVWRGVGGGGAFGLRASHGWSVGAVARRVPEARVVGGLPRQPLMAALPRHVHGAARVSVCAARSSVLLARAPPTLGLRRGLSDATRVVTARLKEEEGVWVTLRKVGAGVATLVGFVLKPVRWAASPLWRLTEPMRSAIAYVFNRVPALKLIPFFAILGTVMNILFLATQKMQHSLTDFLRTISYYLTQMVLVFGGILVAMWVGARHRLSMRAVHNRAFRMMESIPEIQQKLGKPIVLLKGKRIEMRTGGHFKLKVPSSSVVNVLEKVTGRDIDNDGDVGLVGSAKPMPVVQDVAPTRPAGLLGTLRANCTALWSRAKLPILKYKKQRAHMVFPVVGPHKEQAMVSVECVKRPGGLISTPFGYYDWKLLSIDFADNTYYIYRGDEERYNRPLISQLRRPMVEWMMSMAAIEDHEEIEDEAERLR